ncbi:MAG: PilX N-terminal domain-containing pilus assembly protein [Planctomycetota bacterium]|jgi:hypothetical protein
MRKNRRKQKGIALFIAMVFVTIFSAISVGMFSMSSNNTIVASNLHQANQARANAESGMEVIRHYMDQVEISGLTEVNNRYSAMIDSLKTALDGNLSYSYDEDSGTLTVGSVDSPVLLSGTEESFYATITPDGVNGSSGVNIEIIGSNDTIDRAIQSRFSYGVHQTSVFDYGVATKGPLNLGNLLLDGVNVSVEADVYIESLLTDGALNIQNGQIAGDVKIVNPDAYVSMNGNSSIGGETGANAITEHVEVGVEEADFPIPNATHFAQYANGITIDSGTDISSLGSLDNVRIAAGTNPKFTADTQINGVLYIESPNVVEFGGNCDITGLVVAEGDYTDNSQENQLIFRGTVGSNSVDAKDDDGNYLLSDSKYDGLRDESGTFVMAPGFAVSFGGNFDTLNGCIVANGVEFFGNAGGEIGGSIVNYSDDPMDLTGNDLRFNRSGLDEVPAGFAPEIIIYYDSDAYSETPVVN